MENTKDQPINPHSESQTVPSDIEQTASSLQEEKKTNKGLIIGLVVLLLIALGMTGVFAFQNYKLKQQTPQAQLVPSPTVSLPTPTTGETAPWEKYINSQVGFSLRYPEELSLQGFPLSTVSNLPTIIMRLSNYKIKDCPEISLSVAKTDMSIEQWIKSQDYCPSTFDSCTLMVPGPIPGSVQFESINRHYASTDTFVKKGEIIFDLVLAVKKPNQPPGPNESQLYNQILSTFQFLDQSQTDKTADWKTFSSNKGYQIKYPNMLVYEERVLGFHVFLENQTGPMSQLFYVDERGEKTLAERKEWLKDNLADATYTDAPIERVQGFIVEGKVGSGYGQGLQVKSAYIDLNGKELIISCDTNEICQSQALSQILSTFKFIQ